ncbi:MAG TPA: hypothetical protein VFQ43_16675 [Nitrososphaera sp.]|nr:hypothetical protein [Nitrososphaera sp.]
MIALGLEPDEIAYLAADPSAAEICFLITELREGRIIHIIGEGREAFERATTTGRREHESISVSHIHKVLAARATAA